MDGVVVNNVVVNNLRGIVAWDCESVKLADSINVGDFIQSIRHFLRDNGFVGDFEIWPVLACDEPARMTDIIKNALTSLDLPPEYVGEPPQPKQVADNRLREKMENWRNRNTRMINGELRGEGVVAMMTGDGGYTDLLLHLQDLGFQVVIIHPTGRSTHELLRTLPFNAITDSLGMLDAYLLSLNPPPPPPLNPPPPPPLNPPPPPNPGRGRGRGLGGRGRGRGGYGYGRGNRGRGGNGYGRGYPGRGGYGYGYGGQHQASSTEGKCSETVESAIWGLVHNPLQLFPDDSLKSLIMEGCLACSRDPPGQIFDSLITHVSSDEHHELVNTVPSHPPVAPPAMLSDLLRMSSGHCLDEPLTENLEAVTSVYWDIETLPVSVGCDPRWITSMGALEDVPNDILRGIWFSNSLEGLICG